MFDFHIVKLGKRRNLVKINVVISKSKSERLSISLRTHHFS